VHFNEEVEVQIVESPAVEVLEVSEVSCHQSLMVAMTLCLPVFTAYRAVHVKKTKTNTLMESLRAFMRKFSV